MKKLSYLLFAFFALLSGKIHAQTEVSEKTISPYFFVQSKDKTDQLPLKSTSAEVNIAGVIADVKVTQVYVNEGKNTLEAIYIFPASVRAAVYGMTMSIGERKIIARIEEKGKAREQYEQAKQEGKTASLLEQQRPNVFQMNVANILPGDKIIVELRYTELIVPTEGVYEFVYPTVVGPRYSNTPENQVTQNEKWVANPYLHEGEKPTYDFNISARVNAGVPIQEMRCTSHETDINYLDKSNGLVKLKNSDKDRGNKDFILRYRLAGEAIQSGILLYEGENLTSSMSTVVEGADEKFFLVMMQPPKAPHEDQIPPREYVFIVDVSGSMNGFPLDVSKAFLRKLIGNLRPTDRFNVMLFESSNQMLSPESMLATPDNINKAIKVIDEQRGGGGTQLLPALKNALAFKETADFSRTFIVVTDGYISVEKEAFELIKNNLNKANLFAFGIGSSVNRFLIDGMARAGLGEPFVITNQNEAVTVAEKFRNYIQNPVLTNIKVTYEGFQVYDILPVSIPDVFAERPIILYGKYKGNPTGRIVLEGLSGTQKYTTSLNLSDATKEGNQALKYLWARTQIAELGDFVKLYEYDSDSQNKIKEITRLGLQYNLLTDYTSFIAVDDEIRNKEGKSEQVIQALPLPEGVTDNALVGKGLVSKKYKVANNAGYMKTTGSQERGISSVGEEIDLKDEDIQTITSVDKTKIKTEKEKSDTVADTVAVAIIVQPVFQGGESAFKAFVKQNIIYPANAASLGKKVKVMIEFVVNEDGTLSDFNILNSPGAEYEAEAIRLLKLSPKWTPGSMGGKIVALKTTITIDFEKK